ncbi:MAG: pirin family protein [Tepidisphaeraceae bacterium]
MINIIPSSQRHHAEHGWLDTHWHFSFADYHDPNNMNWGALRVFNDDIIHGGGGFDLHPHRDMEIVTIVYKGELRHQDDLGNAGVIHPGEVQVMTAGRGIVHAEHNNSATDPVHLLQIWIIPRHRGNTPRWEQKQFDPRSRLGKLLPVVSGGDVPQTLEIDQNAIVYLSKLSSGQQVQHTLAAGRKAYLFVVEGKIELNDKLLSAGDQARIDHETHLDIAAKKDADLILLDLP